jgi:hypothetical protein
VISNEACANYLYNAYVSLLLDFETSNACLCIVYLFLLQRSEGKAGETVLAMDLYRAWFSGKWHALGGWGSFAERGSRQSGMRWEQMAVGWGSFAERGSRQRADGTSGREVTLFCREALFGSRQTLCRVSLSWLSANSCLPERCTPGGLCRVQLSAKALPAVIGPLPSVRGTRRTALFQ